MRRQFSREFKESVIQKITTPGGPTATQLSKDLGIHNVTINKWKRLYANMGSMKDSTNWTPERKLQAIAQTFNMSEKELGEYLRANGLHSAQLEEWKQDFYSSQKSVGRPKLDPELVELRTEKKSLESNLKRKDKALAEMSARIILLKKSRLIFGGTEDDE